MKLYQKPDMEVVHVESTEAFSAYSGCVGNTYYATGLGTPTCTANTPDAKDGDCWLTPHA